jgi:hypothetical protein
MNTEELSQTYFECAYNRAYADLRGNLSLRTDHVYILLITFKLCSCYISGAFLYFGVAVRAASLVGLLSIEVNVCFGAGLHLRQDWVWKSLGIVDPVLGVSIDGHLRSLTLTAPFRTATAALSMAQAISALQTDLRFRRGSMNEDKTFGDNQASWKGASCICQSC